ncbi:sensor histidine kinase [Sphaerobacter thermophilus]|uniref:sensor histidine kinase n=1 Tax=Sphaerobacter thermophilus TaxID=2057 RepID=UPI0001A35F60|nr:HAMP domain-containing sensor histidine kinase [Sphaerobacter thermophilus]
MRDTTDALSSPLQIPAASPGTATAAEQALPRTITPSHWIPLAAALLSFVMIAWVVVNLASGWVGFATFVPNGLLGGMEAAISLARLFAALVLVLIVADGVGARLRWLAAGFVVLGLGQFAFGYIEPILVEETSLDQALYEMILVRALAAALFVIGLVSREPPRFTVRSAVGVALVTAACVVGYVALSRWGLVPPLVMIGSLDEAARRGIAPMTWLTGWHWAVAAVPFGLAVVAGVGSLWRYRRGEIGGWVPLGIILLAGSELHDSLWPSAYGNSALLNTADVLRLTMAAVIVAGGALELKRLAAERARLLASERERARRLEELTRLKADFTAMVAHELGYPLSAIRRLTELLARDGVNPELRNRTLASILRETDALDTLVADVQAMATVERDDFRVDPHPIPVSSLVEIAVAHSEAHPEGRAPLGVSLDGLAGDELVLADRERIGQVLRNLLCNAARYSPPESPIELRVAAAYGGRVRVEVSDHGPGIHPDDLERIFDKFARGRNGHAGSAAGVGLGLYLARRIVRAHGSDITVQSSPGAGSTFAFELTGVAGT